MEIYISNKTGAVHAHATVLQSGQNATEGRMYVPGRESKQTGTRRGRRGDAETEGGKGEAIQGVGWCGRKDRGDGRTQIIRNNTKRIITRIGGTGTQVVVRRGAARKTGW